MNLLESRGLLIQEATELLANMELALLEIEEQGVNAERINEVFRAAHTIKGSSGLFGLDLIVSFTHVMESLLVRVRNQDIEIDSAMISLLFHCGDYLAAMIEGLAEENELQDPDPAQRHILLNDLKRYLTQDESTSKTIVRNDVIETSRAEFWQISMRLSQNILREGLDPVSFIYYLRGMGELVQVQLQFEQLPLLAEMESELCYLGFDIVLHANATQHEIQQALEFISDNNEITVKLAAVPEIVEKEPGNNVLEHSRENSSAVIASRNTAQKIKPEQSILKVDARKLDQLIDAVGELVIRSASGRHFSAGTNSASVREFMEEIGQYVEQIRERALNLRMAPINDVFQRFPRVVRDTANELHKKIELVINGADTEIDKSMLDKLGDPLMHILRNAMDHGIESVNDRRAAGKTEQGLIRLDAFHESGFVVIDIYDDGKGLDQQKILAKAIERGLVEKNSAFSEQEIFMLIFEAGFSTAEKVTDLSGRGVGMDVVRRNIEELRGNIEINSTLGEGTHFRIRLPLTLSIIDGFEVAVGNSHFVIPLEMIVECVDMPATSGEKNIVNLRGSVLPYIRLGQEFSLESALGKECRECLVVLQVGQQYAGIVVDRLIGELQAVIKPLNQMLRSIDGLAGSTILGDGSVALILDVAALLYKSKKMNVNLAA